MYLRKSRSDAEAEARGEGETLARHKQQLLELAAKQGLTITATYQELVSGDSIDDRPEMQKLLREVESCKFEAVLVMDVDRLARGNTIDQGRVAQTFKNSSTKIITPNKTYDPNDEFDEEYFEFSLFMARREYKMITRRMQRGRVAAVKEGKYLAQAPFGYKRVKLESEKGYTLEPDPETSATVKFIFDLYANGRDGRHYGIELIAKELNQLHIKPHRHDYWQKETIRDMLQNPAYIGKVRWGYRKNSKKNINGAEVVSRPINSEYCIIAEGLHPAIIDEEVFNRVQQKLAEVPAPPLGYRKEIKNPLAGLIICGKCGHRMTLRPGRGGKANYLVCKARNCGNVSSRLDLVETRLVEALRDWLRDYRLKWEQQAITPNDTSVLIAQSVKQLEAELETLKKQLSRAFDLYEQDEYTKEIFASRSSEIKTRISVAKANIAEVYTLQSKTTAEEAVHKEYIPAVDKLLDVYETLPTAAAKNELMKEVIVRAVYTKKRSGAYKDTAPDDFDLQIFPKLPQGKQ
jgi:DNA invertase Pin-like site-specific DNA recombinase